MDKNYSFIWGEIVKMGHSAQKMFPICKYWVFRGLEIPTLRFLGAIEILIKVKNKKLEKEKIQPSSLHDSPPAREPPPPSSPEN